VEIVCVGPNDENSTINALGNGNDHDIKRVYIVTNFTQIQRLMPLVKGNVTYALALIPDGFEYILQEDL